MVNSKSRCVICAAAPVRNPQELRILLRPDDFILASDGGLYLARLLGRRPDRIVADFDSAEKPVNSNIPVTVLPVKKDDTDTFAAAKWAYSQGFRDFLLLGCTGGRTDHTLANLAVMAWLAKAGCHVSLAAENEEMRMLMPGRYMIPYHSNSYLSLMPYGGDVTGVYEKNVMFELNDATLTIDYPLGISNQFLDGPAEISFETGILLLIISKN